MLVSSFPLFDLSISKSLSSFCDGVTQNNLFGKTAGPAAPQWSAAEAVDSSRKGYPFFTRSWLTNTLKIFKSSLPMGPAPPLAPYPPFSSASTAPWEAVYCILSRPRSTMLQFYLDLICRWSNFLQATHRIIAAVRQHPSETQQEKGFDHHASLLETRPHRLYGGGPSDRRHARSGLGSPL